MIIDPQDRRGTVIKVDFGGTPHAAASIGADRESESYWRRKRGRRLGRVLLGIIAAELVGVGLLLWVLLR